MTEVLLYCLFFRLLRIEEIVREGLAGKCPRPNLQVKTLSETGRGVIALEPIGKGRYVCEYKTSSVYPASSRKEREQEHARNDAGSYVIDTAYAVEGLSFDATERYHHQGRYINHAARGFNLNMKGPYYMRGKWRIGFVTVRDVKEGEELCYDYGMQTEGWLRKGHVVEGRICPGVKEGECSEETKEEPVEGDLSAAKVKNRPGKCRYVWCPLAGCPSGPVQKITQHLSNVHKLGKLQIRKLTMNKRYAPPEAIKNKLPNPHPSARETR